MATAVYGVSFVTGKRTERHFSRAPALVTYTRHRHTSFRRRHEKMVKFLERKRRRRRRRRVWKPHRETRPCLGSLGCTCTTGCSLKVRPRSSPGVVNHFRIHICSLKQRQSSVSEICKALRFHFPRNLPKSLFN